MEINIVDYKPEYLSQIETIHKNQWGNVENDYEIASQNDNFIKVAIYNNKVVGEGSGRIIGDSFHITSIVIAPEFQYQGIGTKFMTAILDHAKKTNCKIVWCEAIEAKGKTNSKKLLEKFGFNELYKIKGYWGSLDPNYVYTECGHTPCQCIMHFYIKEI